MDSQANFHGPWVADLGYDRISEAFVQSGEKAVDLHAFAPELRAIFASAPGQGGSAVFCIDHVPTVCLIDQEKLASDPRSRRDQVRDFCERLWNQNLARIVLVTDPDWLEVWCVDNPDIQPQRYSLNERATARNDWSVSGLLGGEALRGRDDWFNPFKRVDKMLLDNILVLVEKLTEEALEPASARRLVARLIFITYLEDREIVGETYRSLRSVRPLFDLVSERDRAIISFTHHGNLRYVDGTGDFSRVRSQQALLSR